eukprot:Amastigsp_a177406_15.p3 type:complete len:106 gc:universal Amastigsp_a177406_15:1029-712(-)
MYEVESEASTSPYETENTSGGEVRALTFMAQTRNGSCDSWSPGVDQKVVGILAPTPTMVSRSRHASVPASPLSGPTNDGVIPKDHGAKSVRNSSRSPRPQRWPRN